MVSVGAPASSRGFLLVAARIVWLSTVALALLACTPDNTAICERLAECKLLPDDYSTGDCERELAGEKNLEPCRDCVEDTACDDIVEKCRDRCLLD